MLAELNGLETELMEVQIHSLTERENTAQLDSQQSPSREPRGKAAWLLLGILQKDTFPHLILIYCWWTKQTCAPGSSDAIWATSRKASLSLKKRSAAAPFPMKWTKASSRSFLECRMVWSFPFPGLRPSACKSFTPESTTSTQALTLEGRREESAWKKEAEAPGQPVWTTEKCFHKLCSNRKTEEVDLKSELGNK